MSADARSVLAAVDGFCTLLGIALFPLCPQMVFALCWGLPGRSVFAVAPSVGGRECSVGR